MKAPSLRSPHRLAPLLALLCSVAVPAIAQTAPAPSAPAPSSQDQTIELTPFVVSSNKDVGYLAQNTLAGSRLNTNLMDTGAAISVLTPEFLQDIGATSMKDIILFSNDAVPEYGDSASNFNANPMIGNPEWQLRIRGMAASYARNYFAWSSSTDFYNIDRIDESRGPNAILFGFGSAGGIVNTTTKQASLTPIPSEYNLTFGSWGRVRGTLDTNVVALQGKLAFRVNAMFENTNTWREFEFDHEKRIDFAAKYQISPSTTLRGEFEAGNIKDNWARPWLMIDQTAPWRAAGSPTFSSAQWSSTVVTQTWSPHLVYTQNTGQLADWENLPFAYSSTQSWAALAMTPENLKIIPMTVNSAGPDATRYTRYHTYSAYLDSTITRNLSTQVAYNHQSNSFLGYDANAGNLTRYGYQGDATELWADASSVLPTGQANPYAGRFYLENNWTRRNNTSTIDQVQASLAYQLDLGKFGRHRIAGLVEHDWRDYLNEEDAEVFVGAPFDPAAEFDSNRVFRRYYFTPGNAADIHVPSWRTPLVNVTDPISGKKLTSGWAPDQQINNSKQGQDTALAALQSYFLNDSLVTIVGIRFDHLDYSTLPTIRNSAGMLALDPTGRQHTNFDAHTLSAGVVYHLTKDIALYANTSDSRDLPNVNQRVIGYGLPPMPKATGIDTGAKFNFFGGKLYATVDYYTTKLHNSTEWGNIQSQVTSFNSRVLQALQTAGLISSADVTARTIDANAYLQDRNADGWEFSLIANPTPNWRLSANFSINHVKMENIMSEVQSWFATNSAYWLAKAASQGGANFMLSNNSWDTLGNNIGWTNDYITQQTAFDGKPARGEREYGGNVYTRYRFSEGALRGFYIGGGGRYQSANIIAATTNGLVKGRDVALADAMVGYETSATIGGRRLPLEFQLNVSNVFDSRKYQIYTTAWWDNTNTIPERIGLQEPRKYTLSATLKY